MATGETEYVGDSNEELRLAELQKIFGGLSAVAQAGAEAGQDDVATLDLPVNVYDRAREIHTQPTAE